MGTHALGQLWSAFARVQTLQATPSTQFVSSRCELTGYVRRVRACNYKSIQLKKLVSCEDRFSNSQRRRQRIVAESLPDVADEAVPSIVTDSSAELNKLRDFIMDGVLASRAGLTAEKVDAELDGWCDLGKRLSHFLNFDEDGLSEAERVRIYQYYLPIYFWSLDQLAAHKAGFAAGERIPPLVIGISAPQGCGKTTIVESLDFLLKSTGRRATTISIDDFYLTGADQDKLALDNPDNGLLEFRGNAGSHDLQFGAEVIKSLLSLTAGSNAKVPRYDKAARSGRGDRGDPSTWSLVEGPLEVLLFEGWMLGFEPQDQDAVTVVDPQLGLVNEYLKGYWDTWHSVISSWIIVEVEDLDWVFEWRLEAEIHMRKKGKGGMTDDEIAEFVSRYMPAYKAFLPDLYRNGPRHSSIHSTLKFRIDKGRNPLA